MPDFRDNAGEIKRRVSAIDAGMRYGLLPDKSGFCNCPFHSEKTGSMKLYAGSKGFYCFGCHASGTVIDLAMRLFGIGFRQAVLRLNDDFNLGLSLSERRPITHKERMAQERKEEIRAFEKQTQEESSRTLSEARIAVQEAVARYQHRIITLRPQTAYEPWKAEFAEALKRITEARYALEEIMVAESIAEEVR